MEIPVLTKFIFDGCLKFYFSSFHFILTYPLTLCRYLWRNPQIKFDCDTLRLHLSATARDPEGKTQSEGKGSAEWKAPLHGWWGKGNAPVGDRRLNLFWTPCTGVTFAADNK